MSNEVVEWAKEHPVPVALGAVAIIGVFWLMSGSSGGSSSTANAAGAYYAAQTNQSNNSAAIQIDQSNNNATTSQTQILANTSLAADTLTANTDITLNSANHDIALAGVNAGAIASVADALASGQAALYGSNAAIAAEFPAVGKFGKVQLNTAIATNSAAGNGYFAALETYLNGHIAGH